MAISDNPRASTKAKMRRFADLYLGGPKDVLGRADQCYQALRPKASNTVCRVEGHHYLHHPYTQAYIRSKTDAIAKQADITLDKTLREIARIGLFDPRKLFDSVGNPLPITELDDDVAAAISGIKVMQIGGKGEDEGVGTVIEYKIADKNSALEKLMKYLGGYEKDNKQKNESLADALLAGISRVKELDE